MKPRNNVLTPFAVTGGVLLLSLVLVIWSHVTEKETFIKSLEWDAYDWRIRFCAESNHYIATNFAFVAVSDTTVEDMEEGAFSPLPKDTWPFPRYFYGLVVEELTQSGAELIAFDILFKDQQDLYLVINEEVVDSNGAFIKALENSGNVILSASTNFFPRVGFIQAAKAIGNVNMLPDTVLRHARPYEDYPNHGRVWHMGLQMAAHHLGINLDEAIVRDRDIVVTTRSGEERTIPLDQQGRMLINWNLRLNDSMLRTVDFSQILQRKIFRKYGTDEERRLLHEIFMASGMDWLTEERPFERKMVLIGSTATGTGMRDIGSTPLNPQTFLVSTHLNVANSLILNRFIRPASVGLELFSLIVLGVVTTLVSWRCPIGWGVLWIFLLASAYLALALLLFGLLHYALPVVSPLTGGVLLPYLALLTYRVVFEQREQRRIKGVFSKIVSPNVVNELLDAERLALGGARKPITVFFADIRGFTQMTDAQQEKAESQVKTLGLSQKEAEQFYNRKSAEVLETVNIYLATIADVIKRHDGTLDKYIGDCVMAFWGAPTLNPNHASDCVLAAIDAQRAIYRLNVVRHEENKRRKELHAGLEAKGSEEPELLPLLTLGTGINTGMVTVGLMGSDSHILNYTVFGREVNLASRLEGLSGRGRIIIGESTFKELERTNPDLAKTCIRQSPASVKGIKEALVTFEVPWKEDVPAGQE